MKLPIIGKFMNSYSLFLFLRSCGALIESGLPSAEAYSGSARTVALIPLKESLSSESKNLSKGVLLSSIVGKIKGIPPYVAPLISAGEASGTLGSSLIRAAGIIDRDISHALSRLTALIEPVMMMGIGCVVGAIALAIMLPIYDVSKVLQR